MRLPPPPPHDVLYFWGAVFALFPVTSCNIEEPSDVPKYISVIKTLFLDAISNVLRHLEDKLIMVHFVLFADILDLVL